MTRREQSAVEVLLVDVGCVEGHPSVLGAHGPLWSLHAALQKAGNARRQSGVSTIESP